MSLQQAKEQPARVPSRAKQAGEIRAGWVRIESIVWTERMLTALKQGVKGEIPLLPWVILHGDSLRCSWSTLFEENHRLESRMRENRTSGSEGEGAGNLTGPSYPIRFAPKSANLISATLSLHKEVKNMPEIKRLDSQISMIDINLFGLKRYGSVYVVQGKKTALVDTGTSHAVTTIVDALAEIGVDDLEYIFVTHIHLDHAGGAGLLAHRYPNAKVVVHYRGARHLIDPARLVESVKAATEDMFEYYGEAVPILPEQIIACSGDEQFYLGDDIVIQTVATPGHASHHLAFFETKTASIFVGDAAGLSSQDRLLPATPPPRFDLPKALASLEKLKGLNPKRLLYAHFGPESDAIEALDRYAALLPLWVKKITAMCDEVSPDGVVEKILSDLKADDILFSKQMTMHELSMSVRGVLGAWERS